MKTYMLRESFEWRLIDTQDDVTHSDQTALGSRLAGEQLLDPDHAGTKRLIRNVLLTAEAEPKT